MEVFKPMSAPSSQRPGPAPQLATFGRIVRRRRRDLELSQEELAHYSGVSAKHIGEIERCNKDPRLGTVLKLLDALGMPEDELFDLLREQLQVR